MLLRGYRPNWALGLVAASVSWLGAPDADACSCAVGSRLEWPADAQTDVPLDTSVIVSGFGGFDGLQRLVLPVPVPDAGAKVPPSAIDGGVADPAPLPPIEEPQHPPGLHLVSPSGQIVVLEEARVLPTVDCVFDYRFYRQSSGQLEPETNYSLYEGSIFVAAFTTGSNARDLEAEIAQAKAIEFETLGTTDDPPRTTTAFLGETLSTVGFVHYVGSNQEVTYRMYEPTEGVLKYDFGAVRCPVVEIMGMDGAVLDTRKLCEPDRCKAHPNAVGGSTCGGNYMVNVEYTEFETLPACSEVVGGGVNPPPSPPATSAPMPDPSETEGPPPVVSQEPPSPDATGAEDPGQNKVPLDSAGRAEDGGCALAAPADGGAPWAWAFGVVGALGLLVQRRRR